MVKPFVIVSDLAAEIGLSHRYLATKLKAEGKVTMRRVLTPRGLFRKSTVSEATAQKYRDLYGRAVAAPSASQATTT